MIISLYIKQFKLRSGIEHFKLKMWVWLYIQPIHDKEV